jgi:hypothetical protein
MSDTTFLAAHILHSSYFPVTILTKRHLQEKELVRFIL